MDATFKTEEGRFNYRVGAIIIHNNKLLMAKNDLDDYYYSVGGRVHLHETTTDAVIREVYEETGLTMEVDHMAVIHENFFTYDRTGEKFHELSFYFVMKDKKELDTICMDFREGDQIEHLHWIDLDHIKEEKLYPEFLKTDLSKPGCEVKHIVTIQN